MTVYQLSFRSMPKIAFAHRYGTESYSNFMRPKACWMEISYILQGCIHMEEAGNKVEIAPCESVVITVYDRDRHFSCPGEYHQHSTVGFTVEYEEVQSEGLILPQILSFKTPDNPVRPLIEQMVLQYNLEPKSPRVLAMLFELMGKISYLYQSELQHETTFGKEWYVARAKQYIIENIEKAPRATDTARFLDISPGYLSHIFTEMTGQTVTQFINEVRVRRIEELVLSYGMDIRSAGEQVGLMDPNYVSRLFKQVRGCTLSELRHAKYKG